MIRIVKMSFRYEHINDFKALFEARRERIRHFAGCTYLELWQDKENPGIFYTYSLWNEAADLEAYRVSDLFQETWSTVKQWFNDTPEAFSADQLWADKLSADQPSTLS